MQRSYEMIDSKCGNVRVPALQVQSITLVTLAHFRHLLALLLSLSLTARAALPQKPPQPGSGDKAWVQFRNGEWLRGEIEDLQDDQLIFDSDELDTVEIDFDDIYALYSVTPVTALFQDKTVCQGIVMIEDQRVTVKTVADELQRSRTDLRSLVPGQTRKDYWSLKWSSGVTLRSGNTEQRDVASFLRVQRRTALARTRLEATNSYSVAQGNETTNNHLGNASHHIFLTRKLYVPTSLKYYRDKIQNIDYSLTPGVGLGYQILNQSDVEWSIDAEGGYQQTRYDSVGAGEDRSTEGASFLAGTRFSWDLSKKLEFNLQYDAAVGLSQYVNTDHHALAQLSFDVWKDLDFDVSLTWDRIGGTQERNDGTKPEADDMRLYVGVGFEF